MNTRHDEPNPCNRPGGPQNAARPDPRGAFTPQTGPPPLERPADKPGARPQEKPEVITRIAGERRGSVRNTKLRFKAILPVWQPAIGRRLAVACKERRSASSRSPEAPRAFRWEWRAFAPQREELTFREQAPAQNEAVQPPPGGPENPARPAPRERERVLHDQADSTAHAARRTLRTLDGRRTRRIMRADSSFKEIRCVLFTV